VGLDPLEADQVDTAYIIIGEAIDTGNDERNRGCSSQNRLGLRTSMKGRVGNSARLEYNRRVDAKVTRRYKPQKVLKAGGNESFS
jgi:hypothetical protein